MKKRIKRLAVLVLAATVCLSLFGTNVWAAGSAAPDTISVQSNSSAEDTVKLKEKSKGHFYFDGRSYSGKFTVYHQFKVSKPALLCLYGDSYQPSGEDEDWEDWESDDMHGSFALCNTKKKKLYNIDDCSDDGDVEKACSYFLVKPGTYYLRYNGTNPYELHLDYKYCSRKTASSKKKAINIKKSKKVSGYFLRGEKESHWYKLKLTEASYLSLYLDAYGTDRIYCYLYGKGIKDNSAYLYMENYSGEYFYGTSKGKALSPGVYYLKVTRKKSNISGQYTIKWEPDWEVGE